MGRGPWYPQTSPEGQEIQSSAKKVVYLAPLAGVSDIPFRRICQEWGADLTYVEMLSATAILYGNLKTLEMMARHRHEPWLGVQLTGRSPDEVAQAVTLLSTGMQDGRFETIDINMGCPVAKVVGNGCGSGLLKSPETMASMIKLAREATDLPLSVKIRLGWDRQSAPFDEILDAVEKGGARWVTIHGRYRCDDYGVPVDLKALAYAKRRLKIPVIGNGNVFSCFDAQKMIQETGVDGLMVSRGALGNPWVFREIKEDRPYPLTLEEWQSTVLRHLRYQEEVYGQTTQSAVVMRKHLLWYLAGWPGARRARDELARVNSLPEAVLAIKRFAQDLRDQGVECRQNQAEPTDLGEKRFVVEEKPYHRTWDPKWEMDRQLDRGVGAL
jgi:tRNA-dihydrouridine synthase B